MCSVIFYILHFKCNLIFDLRTCTFYLVAKTQISAKITDEEGGAGIATVLTKLSNTSNYLVSRSRKWLMVCSLQEWQLWWPYIFMETVWLNLKYSINSNFMWITWILWKLSEQKCVLNFSLLLLFRAEIFVVKELLDALSTIEKKWSE